MSTVAREEFTALLRESFLPAASKGWEARGIGMSEEQLLVVFAEALEPLVQSIVRKVTG